MNTPAGIGLEATLGEWVQNIVAVGREIWRVLRDDGIFWLNCGDAYNSGGVIPGLHTKDMMGQPWRVAFALQDDGWLLRSAIVWHKPNPMPESVRDRPTNAYEMIFLLAKQGRYFYDAEAVREPKAVSTIGRDGRASYYEAHTPPGSGNHHGIKNRAEHPTGANARNVWSIPTQGRPDAHFATYPDELPRRCILAGTSERGVCADCGAPWVRMVEKELKARSDAAKKPTPPRHNAEPNDQGNNRARDGHHGGHYYEVQTLGWQPTCCDCEVLVRTPVGDGRTRLDPTLQTGRKGLNRERNTNEPRTITRREQRHYAKQIRESAHKEDIRKLAGDAFDHYIRTDQSGARPLPPGILATCIDRGWLQQSDSECNCPCSGAGVVPATVLDPFAGSGTTLAVAQALGRKSVGLDLNPEYLEIAQRYINRADGITLSLGL